jgi:amino acid transporter
VFALARDGHLPRMLGGVHTRFKTPHVAATVIAIAAIVTALIVRVSNGLAPGTPNDPPGHWFPFFQFGATIGAFLLFGVYLLIALTGFKGQPGENRAGLALAGVLAGATSIAALYGVIYKAPSIYWFDKIWWLALIWVALGIGVVALAKSRGNLESRAPAVPG